MKAVMLEVPKALLEERRRLGHDRHDELWEGVLHMVPQPLRWHQELGSNLLVVLHPHARARGLRGMYGPGFYRHEHDYRTPDLAFARPDNCTERGIEGAVPVVFEILSPNDESHEKIPWYLAQGVSEVIFVDPHSRRVERHAAAGVEHGRFVIEALGVALETVDGPKLRVTWEDGGSSAEF